jgi:hypothetical protein
MKIRETEMSKFGVHFDINFHAKCTITKKVTCSKKDHQVNKALNSMTKKLLIDDSIKEHKRLFK